MRWTIGKRIFAAITLASLVVVGLEFAATRYSFDRSFSAYLDEQDDKRLIPIAARLAEIYAEDSTWDGLRPERWNALFRGDRPRDGQRRPPPPGERRPPPRGPDGPSDSMELHDRVSLLDANGKHVIGPPPRHSLPENVREIPIEHNGQQVGTLLVSKRTRLTDEIDIRFATEQKRTTQLIALIVLVIAAAIAALVARQLTKPVRKLAEGTQELTAGNFDTRITVARDDELGDLALDFNKLAQTLQQNRESRRQWVSDIAHELRTPLSILSGELQAIDDGVRQFDDATKRSLRAEVDRLGKLVSDMQVLTTSDEGALVVRRDKIELFALVREVLENSSARLRDAGLRVDESLPKKEVVIDGDFTRLEQLFTNLIENSIRYTNSPGHIELKATSSSDHVTVTMADSKPGVDDRDLPRLFDRLYRVDASRNRATGGSGLGLAICSAIVEAHGGDITAHHSELGGIEIVVQLPLSGVSDE